MSEQACDFKEGDLVVVKPEYAAKIYETYNHTTLYGVAKCELGKSIAFGKPAIVICIWNDKMCITDKDDTTEEFIATLKKWFKPYKAMNSIDHLL